MRSANDYRFRAEELRVIAEGLYQPNLRAQLESAARQCDSLADFAATWERRRLTAPTPTAAAENVIKFPRLFG